MRGTRAIVLLAAGAALALGGCQTLWRRKPPPAPAAAPAPPPKLIILRPLATPPPKPVEQKPCVPKTLDPPPRYPDTDAALRAAGGAADRYQLMAAGRILRQQRLDELEKAIAACR